MRWRDRQESLVCDDRVKKRRSIYNGKRGGEKGNKTLEIACNKADYISTMLQKKGKRR